MTKFNFQQEGIMMGLLITIQGHGVDIGLLLVSILPTAVILTSSQTTSLYATISI